MSRSKFQTIVEIPDYPKKIGYATKSMFMGSCFTENIGKKMSDLKFPVDINPFGILYNPLSVAMALSILLQNKPLDKNDLIQHNGLWHSFMHHGKFSSVDKTKMLEHANWQIQSSSEFLKSADFLFITFGTAWVYRYNKNNKVVSNCHKIPAKEFTREKNPVQEITKTYGKLLQEIWTKNPKLKVVFTVSPIRHWKDGAIENQRSKSTLLLAIENLTQEFGPEKCNYFPSYEIVMDELRDYRFYAEDMLHLSEVAVNHIWELFETSLIHEKDKTISAQVSKIHNAINHRPINPESQEFKSFTNTFLKKIDDLETKFPNLNFKLEKEYFSAQLGKLSKNESH